MTKSIKHQDKADYLIDKGIEVLWASGYNGTSVNDIVKAAGIPKGSFYFYFDSKEDFVIKAMHRYFDTHYKPALGILYEPGVSAKQRLLNFYAYRFQVCKEEMACKRYCLVGSLGNEMSEQNENVRKAVVEIFDKITNELLAVAKQAQEAREIDTSIDIQQLVDFIEDACKGAMATMKDQQDSYSIDNVLHMIKTMILK